MSNQASQLFALLSALSGGQDNDYATTEKCPATKAVQREISLEFDLEEFCAESNIDASKIDKTMFYDSVEAVCTIERSCSELSLRVQTNLKNVLRGVTFVCLQDRIDAPDSNVSVTDKYQLMAKEDAAALAFFKKCFATLLQLPSTLNATRALENVCHLHVGFIHGKYALSFAKKRAGQYTFRVTRDTVEAVIPALLEELARYQSSCAWVVAKTKQEEAKWKKVATDYNAAEAKKQADKKAKERAEANERMTAETTKLAEAAAALKVQLGNPTLAATGADPKNI